jgi:hypothetical protein
MSYDNAVLNERQKTHGDFADTAVIAQSLKAIISAYRDQKCKKWPAAQLEAMDMICTKISRIVSGSSDNVDHWRDLSAYAELVVEKLKRQPGATDARSVRMVNHGGEWIDAE